ncbi:winged helix-turn-helix transcriptional regulator [Streptomyces sp. NPDC096079]|uniref:winged helix-turn-helix transcriptional regulator n=1 Tax=Streptomyces sp. NPDC096079 TaxID=3155820 RepID=UPI0033342582
MRSVPERDAACAIAQAAAVIGDWWSLLLIRETARGHHRFDALQEELGISRKVLTERLAHLVETGVLEKVPYQDRPVRHEYRLTESGRALLPVLLSMQDWADRWIFGDGSLSGTADEASAEARRVAGLAGERLPDLKLPGHRDGAPVDPVADTAATVLFCYPATGRPSPLPDSWSTIPGALGCTLENRLFKNAYEDIRAAGAEVRGISTQRPEEQRAFAVEENIPFTLLSDVDLHLAAALRLPTFRAGQLLRLKRAILVVDHNRTVRHTHFPVTDIPAAVDEALTHVRRLTAQN